MIIHTQSNIYYLLYFSDTIKSHHQWQNDQTLFTLKNPVLTHPLEARYLAAGEVREIEPAGLMWSVVTLSPRLSSTAASSIPLTGGGSLVYNTQTYRHRHTDTHRHTQTHRHRHSIYNKSRHRSTLCIILVHSKSLHTCKNNRQANTYFLYVVY